MFRALFFLFFLFAVMWVLEINTPESFFKDESLVHNFDVKSLGSWAAKQHMQASVVLFYNNKSALSKSYLPTFAEAANQAANWTEFVKFYSFECASNLIVCYKFGFQSPPLVKYFSADTPVSDFGQKIRTYLNGTDLLKEVVTKLNTDYANQKCPKCPNLRMYHNTREGNKYIFSIGNSHEFVQVESADDPRGVDALLKKEKHFASSDKKHTIVWRALEKDLIARIGNQTIKFAGTSLAVN